ncbi:hypothetical protein GOODEAATRI_018611 [Goodea atripinnis]|uniref:Uncharacterized protein n=1 Tax=Goodea atripinnis TaxID=208336 RepID=A0ABV0PZW1_9TELE
MRSDQRATAWLPLTVLPFNGDRSEPTHVQVPQLIIMIQCLHSPNAGVSRPFIPLLTLCIVWFKRSADAPVQYCS